MKVSRYLYCFTLSDGVENYFPRLWGTGSPIIFFIDPRVWNVKRRTGSLFGNVRFYPRSNVSDIPRSSCFSPEGILYFVQNISHFSHAVLILNFYCVNTSYPMDNCFTGRRDRSRQTPEKDVL